MVNIKASSIKIDFNFTYLAFLELVFPTMDLIIQGKDLY